MTVYLAMLRHLSRRLGRFALFAALLCGVGAAAGLMGARLINGGEAARFTVVVVDQDDSIESRMILSNLADSQTDGLLSFVFTTAEDGLALLRQGAATAVFTFPSGYARDIRAGVNPPFNVLLNAAQPFKAALVRYYADAFTDMLTAAQSGVYTALDYANAVGDEALWNKAYRDVNVRFLALVLKRGNVYETVEMPAFPETDPLAHYVFSAAVLLLALSAILFTDAVKRVVIDNAERLRAAGVSPVSSALGVTLAVFTLLAPVGLSAGFAAAYFGLPVAWPPLLLVTLCAAAWSAMAGLLFGGAFAAGLGVSLIQLAALFVSGGVIPPSFLPPTANKVGQLTFNYWSVRALTGQSGGLAPLAAITALFLCASILLIIKRGARR